MPPSPSKSSDKSDSTPVRTRPSWLRWLVRITLWITGLAAAAAGLLFAMGLKMLKPILKSYLTIFTIALTIVFMLIVKIPLALTLLILVSINVAVLSLKKRGKNA